MIDEKPSLDSLTVIEHHGVKGMRWGVRKGRASGGVFKTKATNLTQRQIQAHKSFRDQKGSNRATTAAIKGLSAVDKNTWGRGGKWEGYHDKKISELERSQERIDQGQLIARTVLFGAQYSKVKK